MAQVTIDSISIAYGAARVIEDLSLEINAGEFFTLLGPSGCGKTTLLRALAGFAPVEAGAIRFGGRDVTALPAHKRDIGMVFQDYALFPDKSVFSNVAYGLRARGAAEPEIKRRVSEYLERVGLSGLEARRPAELSGGQRQRVALARALVIQPQLLLMDEPLSNLDAKLRHQVRETIAALQREAGITTVFVTHDQEEALALSDRIGLMRQGRIEQNASPNDIYENPVSAYAADFIGAANIIPVETRGGQGLIEVPLAGARLMARAPQTLPAGGAALIARPEDITLQRASAAGGLRGVIAAKQYLGSRTSYRILLEGGVSLKADLSGPGHDGFARDEAVAVRLDPAKAFLVRA